jgi:cellulose synthase/poly-beta-1,6-N-acetylglucosamine synthase-like glycosyltransferase
LYYNIPTNDPLQQSLIPFFGFMEPLKNLLGVAWCTGSGYVMRRRALEDIGRFPTYSLAEDVFTSSLMLGAGWKTTYVDEPVQHGLMPDSLAAHLKQRTRWVSALL